MGKQKSALVSALATFESSSHAPFSFSLQATGGVSTPFQNSAIDYRGSHGCSVIIELECVGVSFAV